MTSRDDEAREDTRRMAVVLYVVALCGAVVLIGFSLAVWWVR